VILNDKQIIERVNQDNMILPFENKLINNIDGKKVISYGLSSFGYDFRLSNKFFHFNTLSDLDKINPNKTLDIIDPKNFSDELAKKVGETTITDKEYFIIMPKSYVLGYSFEKFNIPNDVSVIVLGKSTYARSGILINTTPMEAGWTGYLTIEIANLTDYPVKLYINEGVSQAIFYQGEKCLTSYVDRNGKYQNQIESFVLPKV
jgi:dCTP deaminase